MRKVTIVLIFQQLADKRVESARVYAENAIRKKNESLQYLRFAARVDAVISRVQSAATMKNVSAQISHSQAILDLMWSDYLRV